MTRISPAIRTALAYVHHTHDMPAHVRIDTRLALYRHTEMVPFAYHGITLHRHDLKPDSVALIARDPLHVACETLKTLGFQVKRFQGRKTSHYIAFRSAASDNIEALAYRSGGGSVTVRHTEKPYVTTLNLNEAEKAWPAILRPAMYVGERLDGETGRDYLQRAIAAYGKESTI